MAVRSTSKVGAIYIITTKLASSNLLARMGLPYPWRRGSASDEQAIFKFVIGPICPSRLRKRTKQAIPISQISVADVGLTGGETKCRSQEGRKEEDQTVKLLRERENAKI